MKFQRPSNYLTANIALWAVSYFVITGRAMIYEQVEFPLEVAERRALVAMTAVPLCMAIGWMLTKARRVTMAQRLLLWLALSALGALIHSLVNQLVFNVIAPLWGPPTLQRLWDHASVRFWVFLVWCVVHFAITADAEARDKSLSLLAAQNRMLRNQLNPHFLFNTLNALSTLILAKDTGRAEQMVLSLSGFLRHSLEKEPADTVTLREELETQRLYLAIEQIRFGDRLKIIEAAPAELLDAEVPTLILQPLVENAVKYGIAARSEPLTITITARAEGGALLLTVSDDGPGASAAPAPGLGVGLRNVSQRLETMYGAAGRIEVAADLNRGFSAMLRMPLSRQ